MKQSTVLLLVLVVLSAAFFVWAFLGSKVQPSISVKRVGGENLSTTTSTLEVKTNDEGGVQVSMQPLDVGSSEWTFNVSLNTHAGSLDTELENSAVLTDDRGNAVTPIRWDGDPPGGHHRSGTLVFRPIVPRPSTITIVIKNIGGVAERKFTWQLK